MESKRNARIQIILFSVLVSVISCQNPAPSNTSSYTKDVLKVREIKQYEFSQPETSPVMDLANFEGLNFFPVDDSYRVKGKIKELKGNKEILLQTTSSKKKRFLEFASIQFNLKGKELLLTAFQEPGKPKELFIPFQDGTNKTETYKGGRYLNASITEDMVVVLDFNLAYQPFCLFNPEYVCPLPPEENKLEIEIPAGEKL